MFCQRLNSREIEFASSDADCFITNVRYTPSYRDYAPDMTAVATARALFVDRIPADTNEPITVDWYASDAIDEIEELIAGYKENSLVYIQTQLQNNNFDTFVKIIEDLKFEPIKDLNFYFENNIKDGDNKVQKVDIRMYINNEKKITLVVGSDLYISYFHFTQAFMRRLLPWWLEDKPATDKEIEFIKTLTSKNYEAYINLINEIYEEKCDFEALKVEKFLTGYETIQYKMQKRSVEDSLRTKRSDQVSYAEAYARISREIRDLTTSLFGIDEQIRLGTESSEGSEIKELFLSMKELRLISANNDGVITFVVKTKLSNYDEEVARTYIDNAHGYLYERIPDDISIEDTKLLFEKIFIEKKIKINTIAAYQMELYGEGRGLATSSVELSRKELTMYMPNPHIQEFQCLGSYKQSFAEMLGRGEMTCAIIEAVKSAQNFNFADGTVAENLFSEKYIFNDKYTAFEMPDGQLVNARKAIEILKKEVSTDE